MSSVQRSSFSSSQPPEHTNKKKFGKNLNKLTKPPAPPIASEGKSTSRNGLLLLSTKRASAGSGLLSKPSSKQPLPSLGLQYESNTSTHDVLLGAVVGASRAEQQPDAWGVADRKGEVVVGSTAPAPAPAPVPVQVPAVHNGGTFSSMYGDNERMEAESTSPSWDDYGGRGNPTSATATSIPHYEVGTPRAHTYDSGNHWDDHDEQGAYMARLAKERAEHRRHEEEMRAQEQKQKAAQRLRELEQKIASESRPSTMDSPIILEKLGSSPWKPQAERPVRTLYDPNRTYSSLVGGAGTSNAPTGLSTAGVSNGGSVASSGAGSAGGGAGIGFSQEESKDAPRSGRNNPPATTERAANVPNEQLTYSGPVIHLSSYEDRDRGERTSSAGPRMLYDPKSGSMVAVPSREETTSGRGGRKDRKKGRKDEGDKEKKKSKSRNAPARGRADSGAKADKRKTILKNEKRLPRTCGVLYARDDKGACYCADGCDGDLGYGAHSVPGGRIRNPDAYSKFTERQQQMYHHEEVNYDDLYTGATFDSEQNKPDTSLQTGFSIPEKVPEKVDWVKPNEKIELITGADESPTLQATAREWAPSQAALAAAAAAAKEFKDEAPTPGNMNGIQSIGSQDIDDEEDSDNDAPSIIGLGFDPTQNMDSVIQSPSLRSSEPPTQLDSVDLGALSLEPALCATNSRHIFAFGSAATWGSSDAPGNNDWGAPIASTTKKLFDSEIFKEGEDKAATFLSLTSTSSWGAGVPSLGGTTSAMNDHID